MNNKILIALLLGTGCLSASGQLNSSVSVEGEYEPLVIETEKLTIFPTGYRFDIPASSLSYELNGVVADFRPDLITMGATGRQTSRTWQKRRGYLDFRLGSYLKSSLHAGYFIINDSVQSFLSEINFGSSTLFRERGIPESYTKPPLKRLYEGGVGLHYNRLLGAEGILHADAKYDVSYFNYFGTSLPKELNEGSKYLQQIPTQTVNNFSFSTNYSSNPSTIKGWHAGTSVNFLSYRRLWLPDHSYVNDSRSLFFSEKGDSETHLNINGGYAFSINDPSAIVIDADADFLFYRNNDEIDFINASKRRNYGIITLKPAYRYFKECVSLKVGADLDVSYDAMGSQENKRFSAFHIAPDILIEYNSKSGIGLFLKATGGVDPSSMELRKKFDIYQTPILLSTQPIYTPLDGRIGLNVGPFAGFSGSMALRYAISKNVPLGGWYQAFLGSYPPIENIFHQYNILNPYSQSVDLSGISISLGFHYSFGKIVELDLDGSFTPQKNKWGIFNGFDRPRFTISALAKARPIEKLEISLSYEGRYMRKCYVYISDPDKKVFQGIKLPNLSDLRFKIGYNILKNLEIYCQGDNLLNRNSEFLPGLQTEGITISGGIYLEF